jgi:hypothetical protein
VKVLTLIMGKAYSALFPGSKSAARRAPHRSFPAPPGIKKTRPAAPMLSACLRRTRFDGARLAAVFFN